MNGKKITVFGGSQPLPGESAYLDAQRLGRLLAQMGCTVLTGGYIGTMEAVSQGAADTGGHVVGVTCEEIENWRKTGPNAWVREERRFKTLRERLFALIEGCDAAVALPGGVGTLGEIALMWNQMVIDAIPRCPIILVGQGWEMTFQAFFDTLGEYLRPGDSQMLIFVDSVDKAADEIKSYFELTSS